MILVKRHHLKTILFEKLSIVCFLALVGCGSDKKIDSPLPSGDKYIVKITEPNVRTSVEVEAGQIEKIQCIIIVKLPSNGEKPDEVICKLTDASHDTMHDSGFAKLVADKSNENILEYKRTIRVPARPGVYYLRAECLFGSDEETTNSKEAAAPKVQSAEVSIVVSIKTKK